MKWGSSDFPWNRKIEVYNRTVFGNHSFRPNQREVINATMSGCDVFVLMPTGGGKSLTYQLPALACQGVTLVVSPLVSLIQDQIMHLLQADIPATYLSANMDWSEQQDILRELNSGNCKYKLLYVTPEKVSKSDALLRQLESLHARESLARIVIDEAHCVSQWGHDFRPDYQGLGILKRKFPNAPVLALTATATSSVREDVVRALGLKNCIIFRQSFNRANLMYLVVPKTKNCLDDIDKFIKENHFDESGIIYCFSKVDCEKVAEKLQGCGHKASYYHGSMDPHERASVQKLWSKDEINIICATVAFGMGINKPDVRFVIHHSLPKSIEGYHQECGRAGRDGQRSSCLLYYSYSDYLRVKHMLSLGTSAQNRHASVSKRKTQRDTRVMENTGKVLEKNFENLRQMVRFCENDIDCRRLLQLFHFGEKFDPTYCQQTCDNCSKMLHWVEKNVTAIAKQLVELVKLTGQKHSSSYILEVYKGSLNQAVKKLGHDRLRLHGAGKLLSKGEASRVIQYLIIEEFLLEDVKKSDVYGSISSILKVNMSKWYTLLTLNKMIVLRFPASVPAPQQKKGSLVLGDAKSSDSVTEKSQDEINKGLSPRLCSALRKLRNELVKEAGDCVMAYHIFADAAIQQICKRIPRTKKQLLQIIGLGRAKVSKYGNRILETIEGTIIEYKQTDKKGGGSSSSSTDGSLDSVKRARDSDTTDINTNIDASDHTEIIGPRKRRLVKLSSILEVESHESSSSMCHDQLIDLELDECDINMEESVSHVCS